MVELSQPSSRNLCDIPDEEFEEICMQLRVEAGKPPGWPIPVKKEKILRRNRDLSIALRR